MPIYRAYIKLSIALALALFTTSASGQSPATHQTAPIKESRVAQEPRLGNSENKVTTAEPKPGGRDNKAAAEKPKRDDLKDEIEAVKSESAAVRELLRKMEEQQKTLLEQVDRLQRRLDGNTARDGSIAGEANCTDDNCRLLDAGSEYA